MTTRSDKPAAGDHEVIEPPNSLAAKAGSFRASRIEIDRLDRSIARMIRNYAEIAAPRVADLRRLWECVRLSPASVDEAKQLSVLAHNFKSEGASFGYPLVTEIARSLCLLIDGGATKIEKAHPPIAAHIAAIEAVLGNRIEGNGGDIGAAIIADLKTAVRKLV